MLCKKAWKSPSKPKTREDAAFLNFLCPHNQFKYFCLTVQNQFDSVKQEKKSSRIMQIQCSVLFLLLLTSESMKSYNNSWYFPLFSSSSFPSVGIILSSEAFKIAYLLCSLSLTGWLFICGLLQLRLAFTESLMLEKVFKITQSNHPSSLASPTTVVPQYI